ncbi:MAG: hypothetical protein ABS63_06085 [Microbacterium sp. SCN 70-27]|nr:MAG: hypothetical protein ABS63_06085 [Microbacterium sp. SCN 70-27]
MRRLGLIDEEGSLTERGQKWRVDGTYAAACDEIIDEIYPAELSSLTDDEGKPDKASVKTWLQHKGLGDSNASNMASTYVMIAERQVPEAPTTNGQAKPRPKVAPAPSSKASPSRSAAASERLPAAESTGHREPVAPIQGTANGPEVRLDIQIHIPATATADQIDQIFASMAKHLYKN